MTSLETRRAFLEFFAARGHRVLPSSPLVLRRMHLASGLTPTLRTPIAYLRPTSKGPAEGGKNSLLQPPSLQLSNTIILFGARGERYSLARSGSFRFR